MKTEIQERADFSIVRYANCWEDADILIAALDPKNRHCLSIGSAGDNSFSLLAQGAASVTIAEMNPAQIACIELRKAAYQTLSHQEFLTLHGELEGHRTELYKRCEPLLPPQTKAHWQAHQHHIQTGFGINGKFENYFKTFRTKILPLVHNKKRINQLLNPETNHKEFYQKHWNTWRWRLLFKLFFSRKTMGLLGRDPSFFQYVEGSVADKILTRTKHALTELDPSKNPYLHWILTGKYGQNLPHALRPENYTKIQNNLQNLTIIQAPIEAAFEQKQNPYNAYNLSDIFEYMSEANTETLLKTITQNSAPHARLAYWNMLAPRSRPNSLADLLEPKPQLAKTLFHQDKAFFYSAFIVEQTK